SMLVPPGSVRTATGRAAAQCDAVRAAAVFSEPVLGFLPFGRCCVVPFLCNLQSLCTLVFGQSTDLRVDLGTEKRHVVLVRKAATALRMFGSRLAESPPRGFIQRGTGGIESDGGHDEDLQK